MASADRLSACVLTTPLPLALALGGKGENTDNASHWRLCPHHSLCAFYTHTQHCLFITALLVSEQSHLYFCYYYYNHIHNDFHNYCNTTNWKQSVKHWQKYLISTFTVFFPKHLVTTFEEDRPWKPALLLIAYMLSISTNTPDTAAYPWPVWHRQ